MGPPFSRIPLPALDDVEGERVPDGMPPVIDAHVHVFPRGLFEALWRWFDRNAWPIRYQLDPQDVVGFLLRRGVRHVVALQYAHRPGIAAELNRFMAQLCAREEAVTGLATVYPGEPHAASILEDAFAAGLSGVKLHLHVIGLPPDGEAMGPVYEACARHDRPLVVHAGREPSSPAYPCDTRAICSAERVGRVLRAHPDLKLCVPHLGADEFAAYERLLERHDNLWLDTTMMLAGYFGTEPPRRLLTMRPDRIMFGTDFPNIPYAWDRELIRLGRIGLTDSTVAQILGGTARRLFSIRGEVGEQLPLPRTRGGARPD